MEKKVLIIAYYWPPSGGSGVQRWLKFVKYLPQFGCTPYVFTPENPSFDVRDESLLEDVPMQAEVIKLPIWEPYDAFKKLTKLFTGKSKSSKPTDFVSVNDQSFFQKIALWVRGNLFLPDPKIFWVRPSAKFLNDFILEQKIRTVITTGPPHSIHLIGKKLKKSNPSLQWIADFRDPWSEWGFLDSLKTGTIAKRIHQHLERSVMQQADEVITITPFYVKQLQRLSGRRVTLLTNGFDEDDFKDFVIQKSDKFYVRHIGTVNEKCDPRPFMMACSQLCDQHPEVVDYLVIEFVGEVHSAFKLFVESDSQINSITHFVKSIKHSELIKIYETSSVLLLVLNGYKDAEGYMPGKLFEYVATGLPVLGVGPINGDADNLLKNTNGGVMIAPENTQSMVEYLWVNFQKWKSSERHYSAESKQYSRRAITEQLVELFK